MSLSQMYPLSLALGLKLANASQPGFDYDELVTKIGQTRVNNLLGQFKRVFSCGHRSWPSSHADPLKRGCEVHCVYADDLEAFLKGGG